MSNNNIPRNVKKIAAKEGCNSVEFVGCLNGANVYSIWEHDESGLPIPTGLPVLVSMRGSSTRIISGTLSLDVLQILEAQDKAESYAHLQGYETPLSYFGTWGKCYVFCVGMEAEPETGKAIAVIVPGSGQPVIKILSEIRKECDCNIITL